MVHSYTCRFTLQVGGGVAKKKSMHKWLDQALWKPKQDLERNGNVKTTILTRGLADD